MLQRAGHDTIGARVLSSVRASSARGVMPTRDRAVNGEIGHMADGKIGYLENEVPELTGRHIGLKGSVEWRGNGWLNHKERKK